MATAVCRGLRSSPDHSFHHTREPVPSSLGFSPSSTGNCCILEAISEKDDVGKWLVQRDNVYVDPLVVCAPSLRLSQKSLELCTENLGNETGSDASNTESSASGVFSLMAMAKEDCLSKPLNGRTRKAEKYACFPPPLTTIKETGALQYKTHREQGRLVLEAVRVSPTNAVFQEERSQGRLTLSFVNDPAHIISFHYEEEDREYNWNLERIEGTEEDEDNAEASEGRTLKRTSGCKDSDHRSHHLQHENRGFTIWVADKTPPMIVGSLFLLPIFLRFIIIPVSCPGRPSSSML